MSDNARRWLIAGGIVGFLCLAACVVVFLVFRQLGSRVAQSIKTDPTGVAGMAESMADFDVPEGYSQEMSMSLFVYDIIVLARPEGEPGMTIMLMQVKTGTAYSDEQMQQALERQSGLSTGGMKVVKTYETTIRGHPATVVIEESSQTQGLAVRELITTFPGRGGTIMLMITGTSATWDQSVVDDFIASIR
jgi:hypothetical protein